MEPARHSCQRGSAARCSCSRPECENCANTLCATTRDGPGLIIAPSAPAGAGVRLWILF